MNVEKEWESFRAEVIPENVPEPIVKNYRLAFLAGGLIARKEAARILVPFFEAFGSLTEGFDHWESELSSIVMEMECSNQESNGDSER